MQSSHALVVVAASFALFGAILLMVPVWLVVKQVRVWREVVGLWIAGWGFVFIGVGTYFAYRGLGSLTGIGVLLTVAGHLMQRRATRAEHPSRRAS